MVDSSVRSIAVREVPGTSMFPLQNLVLSRLIGKSARQSRESESGIMHFEVQYFLSLGAMSIFQMVLVQVA